MATLRKYIQPNHVAIGYDTSPLWGTYQFITVFPAANPYDYAWVGCYNGHYEASYILFENITIPKGSTINSVNFHVYCTGRYGSGVKKSILYGDKDLDASLPTSLYDFRAKVATDAFYDFDLFNIEKVGDTQDISITNVVKEIVEDPDWESGNNIGLILAEFDSDFNSCVSFGELGNSYIEINYTPPITRPTVTTQNATNITSSRARLNGTITDTGGENCTRRGFVLDTSSHGDPGNVAPSSSGYSDWWYEDGSYGTGSYYINVAGLSRKTTYYVRAFAKNSKGYDYGNEISFQTLAELPTVTTQAVSNIEETTATGNGKIVDTGGENCSERGICWNTTGSPTTSDSKSGQSGSFGTGSFSYAMSGLSPGTKYYVRAYAKNSAGTSYGDQVEFRTKPKPPYNLSATAVSKTQIDLTWNRGSGATHTMIRRSQLGYPDSVISGELVYDGTGTNWSDTGLNCGTTYFYSAWSYTDSTFSDTYDTASGTTYPCVEAPTVTTQAVTDIGKLTATGNGKIINTGGENCDKRGICWNTTGNPTVSDSKSEQTGSFGTGAFSRSMTGLSRDQTYYVRAYAHNSAGYGYGEQVSFKTKYAILKVYNGSSWVPAKLKVYTGDWTSKPLKIYVNGEWKEVETGN